MDKVALDKITYGLYVSGVKDEKYFGGCIVDAFVQVTLDPPTVIYSSMKKNRSSELLLPGTEFSISVLPENVSPFIISNFGFQSARVADKWANVKHHIVDGLPVLDDAAAFFRCSVIDVRDLGTHNLLYCSVLDATDSERKPLVYDMYRQSMKREATELFMAYKKTGISPLL